MSSDTGRPKHRPLSPYSTFEKTPEKLPEAPLPKPAAPAETPPCHRRFSWHRRLALWALAGGGMLSVGYVPQPPPVVHVGTAQPPPPAPQPPWLQALAAQQKAQAPVQLAQDRVAAAVEHVASGSAVPTGFILNLPPVQSQLAVHITEHLRSQSEQAIDIVVEAEPQKASAAQVSEAKSVIGEVGQSVLKVFAIGGLAEAAATTIRDKGLELAWRKLKHMVNQLKARTGGTPEDESAPGSVEAAASSAQSPAPAGRTQPVADVAQASANPILMRLAESFTILARLFDLTEAGAQSHTIQAIAAALGVSERQAGAILQLGPFVESSAGVWALDVHLADPQTVVASYSQSGLPYLFSWQSSGKKQL